MALASETSLPRTLADVVRARIGGLDPDVHDALLAASCMASPTVELVSSATISDDDRLVELLENAESHGIIAIDGNQIHFAHPLLARGVYTEAAPSQRRTMHRRLADIVDEPELRARHLALAATSGDQVTLQALDAAAETARTRGAPAAAAELMDLAIGLGGDTAERRLRSALHHFDAGDQERARAVLEETIERLAPGDLRAEALSRLAVVRLYGDGFFEARALTAARAHRGARRQPAASADNDHVGLSPCCTPISPERACEWPRRPSPTPQRLSQPHLLGLALGMRVTLRFLCGEGFDEADLRSRCAAGGPGDLHALGISAIRSARPAAGVDRPPRRRPCVLEAVRRRCVEKGEEGELIFIAQHVVLSSIWRGDFVEAALVAEDAMERARQLGGDTPLFLAYSLQASWPRTRAAKPTPGRRPGRHSRSPGAPGHFGWRSGSLPHSDSSKCRWAVTRPRWQPCSRW